MLSLKEVERRCKSSDMWKVAAERQAINHSPSPQGTGQETGFN